MVEHKVELQELLEDCLQQIRQGATVEDCLRRYPHHARELRPLLKSVMLVKQHPKLVPTPAQIEAMEAKFLQKVKPPARPFRLGQVAIAASVVVVILVVTFLFALTRHVSPQAKIEQLPTHALIPSSTATLIPTVVSTATATPSSTSTETSTPTLTLTPSLTLTATTNITATSTEVSISTTSSPDLVDDNAVQVTLWAGQTIDVGTLTISNDVSHLYVTFDIIGGWQLQESHIDIRREQLGATEIPVPGQFPYKTDPHDPATTHFSYTIPLDALNGIGSSSEIVILAHASVIKPSGIEGGEAQEETAWGGNREGTARRWYFYTLYTLQ